jgi:hypothetical protein
LNLIRIGNGKKLVKYASIVSDEYLLGELLTLYLEKRAPGEREKKRD